MLSYDSSPYGLKKHLPKTWMLEAEKIQLFHILVDAPALEVMIDVDDVQVVGDLLYESQ